MENDELKECIKLYNTWLEKDSKVVYELVFVKIFVKFEKFLSIMFIKYAIGESSIAGYTPNRKLEFSDEEHLNVFMKQNKKFVNYFDCIQNFSKHIFSENPFSCILETEYATYMRQMYSLRNFIVHESEESKTTYKKTCLSNDTFIEPYQYLLKINKQTHKNMYSTFITKIIEMSDIICTPK